VIDSVGDQIIEYDYASDIGQCLFFHGAFEQQEIEFFARLIARDAAPVVLDIGANIGVHSLAWANANRNATIYAFEPSQSARKLLHRNVEASSCRNQVVIVPRAISNEIGHARFFQCDDNAFSSLKDTKRKRVVRVEEVDVTTVDSFVAEHEISELSLVKIDAEGAETEVILGAINTLRSLGPDLFVEIYGGTDSNPAPERTIKLISDLGYNAFVLKSGQPVPYERHDDAFYNYYFTRSGRSAVQC